MNYSNLSGFELNQLAMAGTISLVKTENLDNGFYCGTWYEFSTLEGQLIKRCYTPSGFAL